MFKNYFNIAVRSLTRYKFYSLLNILGLSIGLASFMLISLFVVDELSYDKHIPGWDRIHRINFQATLNGTDHNSATVGSPTAEALVNDYPEVLESVRLNGHSTWFIRKKESLQTFKEEYVLMADSNYFEFFGTELIYGNVKTALVRPNTIAISESIARKVFGEDNPLGETVVLDNRIDYEVTAVYPDLPTSSHMRHDMLLSMSTFDWVRNGHWLSTNFPTYIKLKEGATAQSLESKFPGMIDRYCAPLISQFLNMNMDEFRESGNALNFTLIPMADIHLHSNLEGEIGANGDIKYVYIFSVVGLFILLLACINFMNLSTARSAKRAKEVGIRKVMGAYRNQLIGQFLSEAILLSLISFIIAYGLALLTIPAFNQISGKVLEMSSALSPGFLIPMLLIMLVVGLFAGSYPAFYLSSFRPVQVLKGKMAQGLKSGAIRSTLVVFQFSISIIMIIGTAIVFDQLSYIQNKKVGYDKDQVIIVEDTWLLREQARTFKNESARHANIISNTMTNFTVTGNYSNSDLYFRSPAVASDESQVIREAHVDYDFIGTMGIKLLGGRNFSKEFGTDSTAVLINEAAVRLFGYEDAISDKLYTYGGDQDEPTIEGYNIIGVVKDFHFQSLKNSIEPLVIHFNEGANGRTLFKVSGNDVEGTLAHIQEAWEEVVPGQPFAYNFLDQKFKALYENEKRTGDVFGVFAFLSIFIACLGLFGLASFTAEQRTKEIGIRKVLGASIAGIITLLSKEFIKLVIIAFVIAAPVSYYFMDQWLTDFEYRTTLKPLTFIVSGVMALIIAWLTMGSQSYMAAKADPAKSLKDE